jgi:hypothetical protein
MELDEEDRSTVSSLKVAEVEASSVSCCVGGCWEGWDRRTVGAGLNAVASADYKQVR